jgi:hypothetical protein
MKEKVMKLKREYEMTFKEGFRLGVRLTRAKCYIENARDAKRLGDDTMAKLFMEFAQDWSELARNAGRKFTPSAAHESEQPAFDFGDVEMQEHLSKLPHQLKETG